MLLGGLQNVIYTIIAKLDSFLHISKKDVKRKPEP